MRCEPLKNTKNYFFGESIMKKHFKITIIQNDGRDCTVNVEEWKNGHWSLFDIILDVDSQMVSEMLVYEKEKVAQGMYALTVDDQRDHWMMC